MEPSMSQPARARSYETLSSMPVAEAPPLLTRFGPLP
jgi:hypothetical protein